MTNPHNTAQPVLTGDEIRAAVKHAHNMSGPSDATQPGEYVLAGALALLSKLRAPVADELCKRCGGPGWYASHTTGYPQSIPCSACNPQGVSVTQMEKDPFLAAQLWRKPADADAYEGAREDLAIWKRRALEAERDLRAERETSSRLVAELNAENGPMRMGDPAALASAPVADTAAIIRDVCELDPADEGPQTISVTVSDLKRIIELHSAPVAGEAVGHVYSMEALVPGGRRVQHAKFNRCLPDGTLLYTGPRASAEPATMQDLKDVAREVAADSAALRAEARNAALEEAAQAAARVGRPVGAGDGDTYVPGTSADAARAIRALKQPQADKDGAQLPQNRPESRANAGFDGGARHTDAVALPPLPSPPQHRGHAMFAGSQMLAYARAAVLADRQRRAMSLEEILTEFRRGCSNTVGRGPENCPECVRAFMSALKALSGRLLDGREWNEVPR
ncbi:hypothetical protein WHX56_13920 [Achromobacter veterisilvae]|uniref:Uncharacterized protein n=1 Tax=Achromobacter veterisilvae TaxID=2069367 RepID=A0ABZ2S6D4_9BURK